MTAQIAESLVYEGKQVSMCSTPLSDYFAFGGITSPREMTHRSRHLLMAATQLKFVLDWMTG